MILDSEREDFEHAIRERGLPLKDFQLITHEDPMTGPGVQKVTGTVTVKRLSKGKEKTYKSGDNSSWPAQFADDLNRGFFD